MGTFLARAVVGLLRRTISELYVSISSSSIQQNLGLDIPADVWFQGWALGIGVSMLGALGPSLDAGSTVPARALAAGEYEARQEARTRILAWAGVSGLFVSVLLAFPGPVHGLPLWGYASAFFLLVSVSCLSPVIVQTGSALIGKLCSTTGGRQWTMLSHVAVEQVARAPGRNSVTVSAIMVGLAVTVGVGLMIHSFRRTVEHWIDQTILADLVVAPTAWLQGGNKGIRPDHMPAAWKDALIAIPGVAAVDPYRELTVEIEGRSVALITRDLMLHAQRGRYLFTEGSSVDVLRNTVLSEGAVLSEVLAETLKVRKGGTLRLRTPSGVVTLPITGVFYDYATDGGKLVMDGELYRRFWGDHAATVFALYLVDGASASDVRRSIEEQLGRSGQVVVLENADIKAEILAIFDRTFRITYALEFIAVLIALLGIINTLLTSIMERQRELATLRALGASSRQVLWLLLLESCWLGFLGAILGVVTGVVLGGLLIFVVNKQSFGWTIEPALSGWLLIQTMGLALAASVIAAYFPARWAARQSLSGGLSYE
jgi:putative ABC transport system permease protein